MFFANCVAKAEWFRLTFCCLRIHSLLTQSRCCCLNLIRNIHHHFYKKLLVVHVFIQINLLQIFPQIFQILLFRVSDKISNIWFSPQVLLPSSSSRHWPAEPNVCRKVYISGAQIPGATSSGLLNFVRWRIILLSPQCGANCMSHFWRMEFWTGPQIFEKSAWPWCEHAARNAGSSTLILLYFA